ncbi:ABC transporter permease [Clostridium chauvoei]|uniref:ABC transporter permease n=2 Tax=Clostridium chauvoei TaxID=46867 RepID=A0ABD4RKE3_9CLOT|nr:ABC transporter permease [Clostridium chauvoei]ATD54123.1 ABC transporter permease [Clostridium chauvoei]ATD58430.1 ABC transporter permease [Clostridium chauvoei]MBX7281661.1 ABC transporter permease [Clostridium chauvoei]MBX7284200.1 ABC transporter permease [Clostridium chauvoei]MBX7286728.1 ABC transporter permease [Clostridium chauvoei]
MKKYAPSIIIAAILLLLWEGVARHINAMYILPSPTKIVEEIWKLRDVLFTVHLKATVTVTIIGLAIAIILGVGLAIIMDLNEAIERALYPLVVVTQTIPITALAPLFVLWFGYGISSKVVVTVLITFFPITVNVYDGFKSTKREMEELLVTYGASKKDIFLKLKIPTAMPHFFSALKMAVPISLIGAAIGEWLGAQAGLGYFSKRMMTQLNGAGVFAPIVILSLLAIILVAIVNILEKKIIKWRSEL